MKSQSNSLKDIESQAKVYPLTRAQQRLWFLHKLNPNSLFYNISLIYNLTGPLDHRVLRVSIMRLVERHEILRANFIEQGGIPAQVIRKDVLDPLEIVDISSYPAQQRNQIEEDFLQKMLARPFDLAVDNLIRGVLLRLEADRHTLILIVHHIITDMWSMDIFCRELSSLYNDYLAGREPSLPEPSLQYTTYAQAQNIESYKQQQQEHETYWHRQLEKMLPLVALPYDRHQQPDRTFNGGIERITIAKRTFLNFSNLCRENNTTLFVGLLTAFSLFLHRLTEQRRLIVGTFMANRSQLELEGVIGLLFNDLPVVIDIEDEQSFLALLAQTRRTIMEVLNHADYSVEELVERLHGHRSSGRSPIYNVTFQLYFRNDRRLLLNKIEARQRRVFQGTKFDLMFYSSASSDSLDIWFNYNSDLFNSETIRRFLHHFNTLLQNIVLTPGASLSELDLLTPEEQYQLSFKVNETSAPYPHGKTIQKLFETQAATTPDRVAVSDSAGLHTAKEWTYDELNKQANHLAYWLKDKGVARGTVVGVLLPRNPDIAVADLGVLKAGGICLLLDTNYPPARVQYMIKDAAATMLITTPEIWKALELNQEITCCFLDTVGRTAKNETWIADNHAEDIAFIVYTSGSTGNPKGVLLSHRAVISQAYHRIHNLDIKHTDRLCLSLSVAFSTLPMQLVVPLVSGALLVIYNEETVAHAYNLFRQADKDRLNLLEVTVSTLSSYLRYIDLNENAKLSLSSLRVVLTAGEKLLPQIARHFYAYYPSIKLVTTFGQSEATGIMANAIIPNDPKLQRVIEGYPSANNRIYIFDQYLKLVPVGVPGTVYFAGEGLASGYVNNPEANNTRFIPDPFLPTERMVNTGDIARRLPDGRLEVLGRTDMMVKIRGNRVELVEVEKHLRSYPDVIDCVVVARDDRDGSKELVGYYTSNKPLMTRSIQQHLGQYLPSYMVPNHILRITEIPLNSNKKVDRTALPTLELPATDWVDQAGTKSSNMEMSLKQIWREVLSQNEIGHNSNFFEMGGHSLKAMELLARIHDKFDVVVSLRTVFSHPTLGDLANIIETLIKEK
ncbi:MAG: amino acid adenylation domain-containing protein [Caldilineaceae bacterium]